MLGNFLQQTTSVDDFLQMHFFLSTLRVKKACSVLPPAKIFSLQIVFNIKVDMHVKYNQNQNRGSVEMCRFR